LQESIEHLLYAFSRAALGEYSWTQLQISQRYKWR